MTQKNADKLLSYMKNIGDLVDDGVPGENKGLMVSKMAGLLYTVSAEEKEDGQVSLIGILPMYGGSGPSSKNWLTQTTNCVLAEVLAKKHHVAYEHTGGPYHHFKLEGATRDNASNLVSAVREWNKLKSTSPISKIGESAKQYMAERLELLL